MADDTKKDPTTETDSTITDDALVETEGAEGEQPPKKNKLKLILMIAVPLVVLSGIAGGLYFTGILGGHKDKAEQAKKEAPPLDLAYYVVPDLLVNLKDNVPGKGNFLKLSVSLEYSGAQNAEHLNKLKPRIVDEFQVYLRELRVEDLQGSAGIHRLREELLSRANQIAQPVPIRDVLFKDILVQ